jgi:hypothetical protein
MTTGTPSCNGTKCGYACRSGRADCNASKTGADTDGCECATLACCGTACQTTHSNGVGQTFPDCVALGTYEQAQAQAACTAFTGNGGQCASSTVMCLLIILGPVQSVCGSASGKCYCWDYAGMGAGTVQTASVSSCSAVCPMTMDPAWN